MGKLIRYITVDGTVTITGIDSTDMVSEMEKIHCTSAVVTAALGRLLTAASIMGGALKGKDDSVTLRMNGRGPAGGLLAVSDSDGNVRSSAGNNVVELPLNERGKLDVAGAVGRDGNLFVIKDMGMKEPYVGSVPIVSGEIAEDITYYYVVSEQTPTVCALGVLVNPDLSVNVAGGFMISVLPFAPDGVIDKIEENVKQLKPVTVMLSEGMSIEEICKTAMKGFELDVLDERAPVYKCNCDRSRVERALKSVGKKELQKILDEDGGAEMSCHFCNKKYRFTPDEIRALMRNK